MRLSRKGGSRRCSSRKHSDSVIHIENDREHPGPKNEPPDDPECVSRYRRRPCARKVAQARFVQRRAMKDRDILALANPLRKDGGQFDRSRLADHFAERIIEKLVSPIEALGSLLFALAPCVIDRVQSCVKQVFVREIVSSRQRHNENLVEGRVQVEKNSYEANPVQLLRHYV